MNLKNSHINLRALEPEDLDFLYQIENDESIWEISNTQTPYSKWVLKLYLENAHQDIFEAKQLRLIIELNENKNPIGIIDVFDFDFKNSRAGIGIILSEENRNKGYANQALKLLVNYLFNDLQLNQVYANITSDNLASIQLFTNFGFEKIGLKKQWIKHHNLFKDEMMFQLINQKL